MAHPLLNEVGFDGPVGHPRARRGAGGGEVVGGADADARGQVDPAQSQGPSGGTSPRVVERSGVCGGMGQW